jgi:hypothetical protein
MSERIAALLYQLLQDVIIDVHIDAALIIPWLSHRCICTWYVDSLVNYTANVVHFVAFNLL